MIQDRYLAVDKLGIESSLYVPDLILNGTRQCRVLEINDNFINNNDIIVVLDRISYVDCDIDYGVEKPKIIEKDCVFGVIKDGVLVPLNDTVIISTDKDKKKKEKFGNTELFFDTTYRPLDVNNVVQDGVVYSICNSAKDSYFLKELKVEAKKGNKVYTHHFLTHEDNEIVLGNNTYYKILYENLFCKIVDGKIIMLNNYNLIEYIKKDKEVTKTGVVIDLKENKQERTGIISVANKRLYKRVKKGDVIYFKRNREYEVNIEGKIYYVIETSDILALK